jgi:uncharacterized protein involved in type VI secretion and phage assembly
VSSTGYLHADLVEVVERLRGRFYGKYRGTVTQVDEDTLRIKATVPGVFPDGSETGWCRPCVPYAGKGVGFAFLPEEKAGVWIEFEGGDVSLPIWVGCYWRDDELPDDATPTVKAIVTAGGNKVLLDDDATSITVSDSNDNVVTLDSGGITSDSGSSTVVVADSVNVNDGALEVT